MLPNFLIIGAMRSGTTSLARYLGAHPDVFMAPVKEVHYFDWNFDQGLDWYLAHFRGRTSESVVGEASQTYMYDALARQRMAETLPEARLLAILRNPVDRAYSHYWMNQAQGLEQLDFPAALEAEKERLATGDRRGADRYSYLDRGRYLKQLQDVCRYFPRESLSVVLFEDLRDDSPRTYLQACRFLGIDETVIPPNLGTPINHFVTFRSRAFRRLTQRVPHRLRNVVGRFNTRIADYPPMPESLREHLIQKFAHDNEALADWLGRDLTKWQK